tara:strand:+ start:3976 stop:4500 length:525 start_codon:yes stop_codon:yes gene_type:complete
MKTIFLLRHAKSSWTDPETDDFDRPLNDRGKRNAAQIGNHLAENSICPDIILCSAAARAQETLSHIRPYLPDNQLIEIFGELYLASAVTIMKFVEKVEETANSVMIIAHNPGLHELVLDLAGRENIGVSTLLNRVMQKYPTGALATATSESQIWADLTQSKTSLVDFVCPKDLP